MRKKYSKDRFYKKLRHVKREKVVMKFRDELLSELILTSLLISEDEIYYSPLNLTLLINGEAYE